jgi:hypothetical protein
VKKWRACLLACQSSERFAYEILESIRLGDRLLARIAEAMGWAPHIVRGFDAGLASNGIQIDVLERIRQVRSQTAFRFAGAAINWASPRRC